MNKNKSLSLALALSSILLVVNLLFRLVDQSKLLRFFPFDYTNDISSYMAQLFFLKTCGFHAFCPYWYQGFTNFLFQAPGWYFFAYPLYLLFGDVKAATYTSVVFLYLIGFLVLFFLYKKFQFSRLQRIFFFAVFFGNALVLGNLLRLGRVHELFAWVVFLLFAFFMLYYRNRQLSPAFYLSGLFYGLLILSNQNVAILASLFYLSLFFVKQGKEKVGVVFSGILGLALSSFWWVPFLTHLFEGSLLVGNYGRTALSFTYGLVWTQIPLTLTSFAFLFFYVFSWSSHKEDRVFFAPFVALSALVFFRLIGLLPLFDDILPDYYSTLLIFLCLFLFLRSRAEKFPFSRFLSIALVIVAVLSVSVNLVKTPFFVEPDQNVEDLTFLLSSLEGSFVLHGSLPSNVYAGAVYSYAPIYYNLTTPFGWYAHVAPVVYRDALFFDARQLSYTCENVQAYLHRWSVNNFLSYGDACMFLSSCAFGTFASRGSFCVLQDLNP